MALDKLTQITSSGINSATSYDGITADVATFDSVSVLGIATAVTVQVGSATTIHTTGIDLGSGNITSHNINSTGIITATGLDINGNITSHNINSTGIITAQSGIHVLGSGNLVGIGTTNPLSRLHVYGTHNSHIRMTNTSDDALDLTGDANRSNANTNILGMKGRWNGTEVSRIVFLTGTDTTDKDDGNIAFLTKASGSSIAERLRITAAGLVGIGTDAYGTVDPLAPLHVSSYSPTTAITDFITLRGASQILCQTSNNVNNSRSGITFSGALHSTDGCSAGIIANHENVVENSETTSLSFYNSLNEVLGERLRLEGGGIMYYQNKNASTQARFGTIDGSNFENIEHTIYVHGHSTSDYTLLRGCNTADGTPVFDAYVNGSRSIEIEADGSVNSQAAYNNISDQRLKENIIDSPSQWDDIKVLKVRKFNFTEASGYPTNTKIGFIAQEVEETSPGLVKTRYEYDEEGQEIADSDMKVVKTSVITVKAVKALQEAMVRIEVLESRLNAAGIAA